MDHLMRAAEKTAYWGGIFGGVLLLLASVVVGIDVVLRKWFLVTLGGADELAGYALAISSAWGLAYALVKRVHIRIDSLYVLLPARVCAVLDIASVLAFLVFFGVVSWHAFFVLEQSALSGSRSLSPLGTPLVIPQALWVAGLVEFAAIALLLLVRGTIFLVVGDVERVRRLLGSRSAVEEVTEEVDALQTLDGAPRMEAVQ